MNHGEELPPSYHWRDGTPTKKKLKGTSAIEISRGAYARDPVGTALSQIEAYSGGKQVILVGSEDAHKGQDPGEIVMRNPVVLKILWSR